MATAPTNSAGFVSDKNLTQYTVSSHQYPIDLDTSNQYGGNKVVFFINVSGDGKFAKDSKNASILTDVPRSEYENKPVDNLRNTTAAQTASEKLSLPTKPMKRLLSAISLYVPNQLSTSYSVSWDEADTTNLDLVSRGIGAITGESNPNQSISESLLGKFKSIGALAGSAAGSKMLGGSDFLQRAARVTPGQSKMEQLFRRVNFRDFSFMYEFAPRDEKEAENVMNIIRTFRHHMLPEFIDQNQFLYIYPSEFEVKYYRGDQENEYLEKQFTAVLTSVNVNYTPQGVFTTFANGMPTQINLNLTFRELSVPTKETSPFDKSGI